MKYKSSTEISDDLASYYAARKKSTKKRSITSQLDVIDICAELHELTRERFVVLYLNARNALIGMHTTDGQPDSCAPSIRDIIHEAIHLDAVGMIVAHNHPGQGCEWSSADEKITRRIYLACDSIGVKLMDHVLLYGVGHRSMASELKWQEVTK